MKKRLLSLVIVLVLVLSSFTLAQNETVADPCSGFWGAIKCFFWGSPEARAGQASWFDRREAVVENQ